MMQERRHHLLRIGTGIRRSTSLLALGALGVLSTCADEKTVAAQATTEFDGVWQTTLSCVNAKGALGYSFRFPSSVLNGVLHGEKGTAGEPGWLQINGSLHSGGTADLYVDGLVGAAPYAVGQRPAGTSYGYHVDAHFTRAHGDGHRIEGRPCTVVWTREP